MCYIYILYLLFILKSYRCGKVSPICWLTSCSNHQDWARPKPRARKWLTLSLICSLSDLLNAYLFHYIIIISLKNLLDSHLQWLKKKIYLLIWKAVLQREQQKQSFCPLVHSRDGCSSLRMAAQEPGAFYRSPVQVQGLNVLSESILFSQAISRSWMASGIARTQTCAHRGSRRHLQDEDLATEPSCLSRMYHLMEAFITRLTFKDNKVSVPAD